MIYCIKYLVFSLFVLFALPLKADEMRVAVTTSFHNSGLSDVLLPEIEKDIGLRVHLLVVGTGQALKLGRQGDVDAILVHSKIAEEKFVQNGYASLRREVMYNDFVIVGPASDPSRIRDEATAASVFAKIKENKSIFISRGDDSGTHRKEISIWKTANLLPKNFSSKWYKSAGSGMGAALNMASAMEGYVLTDRASWLKFKNKREQELLFAGDPVLYNQYAYLPISVKKHPHVKRDLAQKLETWLAGEKGQGLIRDYKVAGQALFIPNAR